MVKSLFSDDARTGRTLLLLALLFGAVLRFYGPLVSNFPLMDGGMFLVAAREVGARGFALPATLPYPTVVPGIPFCYPPLAFYLAALLRVIGVPLETSLRFVPAFFSTACIWALWRLGLAVFADWKERRAMAGLSALTFALLPWPFLPLMAGGGLTRAPGLFFALWGVERAVTFWRDGDKRAFWGAAVLLALCIGTHLERAHFLAIALFVVWLAYNRSYRGLVGVFACIGVALLLTSPWWGLCLARFGASPFLASYASGSRDWIGTGEPRWKAAYGAEYQPLLLWFSLLGMAVYWRRLPFLWLWFGVIVLTEVRSGRNFLGAPESLAAAAMFYRVRPPEKSEKSAAPAGVWTLTRAALAVLLALWLGYQSIFGATHFDVLSPSMRAAMSWCRQNTPADARFAIVPVHARETWFSDWESEWFPALADRTSPLTVQGSEWLPNRTFARVQRQYFNVWLAPTWKRSQAALIAGGVRFDYIFLPRRRRDIEAQLRADSGWKIVYTNKRVLVFARQKEDGRAAS